MFFEEEPFALGVTIVDINIMIPSTTELCLELCRLEVTMYLNNFWQAFPLTVSSTTA